MTTPAYVLGVLDTLVKSGEVSPDYAAGVASVIEKSAGLFWDSFTNDYQNNYMDFRKKNPSRVLDNGAVAFEPDEATKLFDDSLNWYEGDGVGMWDTIKNRVGKWTSWRPGNTKTPEMYDFEYKDMQNAARLQRMNQRMANGQVIHPEMYKAIQDAHVRDANNLVNEAKDTMSDTERRAAGLTDNYADRYRTAQGSPDPTGGLYKMKYDVKKPEPKSYGDGLQASYLPKSSLIVNRPVY